MIKKTSGRTIKNKKFPVKRKKRCKKNNNNNKKKNKNMEVAEELHKLIISKFKKGKINSLFINNI